MSHEENLALVRARLVEVHADPGRERRPFLGELVLGVVVAPNFRTHSKVRVEIGLRLSFSAQIINQAVGVVAARMVRPVALVVAGPLRLFPRTRSISEAYVSAARRGPNPTFEGSNPPDSAA